tara:strand:- start:1772 stop:1903 length:132 start_codon:yes stop_codon:yes gene_type:complete
MNSPGIEFLIMFSARRIAALFQYRKESLSFKKILARKNILFNW